MPGVKRKAMTNFTSKTKRRKKATLTTRIKAKKPTARNQQKQLVTLSRRVARNSRYLRAQKVFTDYQYGDAHSRGIVQNCKTATWYGWTLTDYTHWQPVMRMDSNVAESQRTFAVRMQLNFRCSLGAVTKGAFLNIFLVTPRSNQVQPMSLTPPPPGAMANLVKDEDYIDNGFQGTSVRLNVAKFHVHAAKYVTLLANTLDAALPTTDGTGNPYSTWRKWQWNVPLKFSVTSPDSNPWHKVPFNQQDFRRKYFLLVYSTNADGGDIGPFFTCDLQSTCINFD